MFNHLVKVHRRKGSTHHYTLPDAEAEAHRSLTFVVAAGAPPKRAKRRETRRWSFLGLYLPFGERRFIDPSDSVHPSVTDRQAAVESYDPPNLA